eukprot:jgi/Botrbrau1/8395/Bobra.0237s0016.1
MQKGALPASARRSASPLPKSLAKKIMPRSGSAAALSMFDCDTTMGKPGGQKKVLVMLEEDDMFGRLSRPSSRQQPNRPAGGSAEKAAPPHKLTKAELPTKAVHTGDRAHQNGRNTKSAIEDGLLQKPGGFPEGEKRSSSRGPAVTEQTRRTLDVFKAQYAAKKSKEANMYAPKVTSAPPTKPRAVREDIVQPSMRLEEAVEDVARPQAVPAQQPEKEVVSARKNLTVKLKLPPKVVAGASGPDLKNGAAPIAQKTGMDAVSLFAHLVQRQGLAGLGVSGCMRLPDPFCVSPAFKGGQVQIAHMGPWRQQDRSLKKHTPSPPRDRPRDGLSQARAAVEASRARADAGEGLMPPPSSFKLKIKLRVPGGANPVRADAGDAAPAPVIASRGSGSGHGDLQGTDSQELMASGSASRTCGSADGGQPAQVLKGKPSTKDRSTGDGDSGSPVLDNQTQRGRSTHAKPAGRGGSELLAPNRKEEGTATSSQPRTADPVANVLDPPALVPSLETGPSPADLSPAPDGERILRAVEGSRAEKDRRSAELARSAAEVNCSAAEVARGTAGNRAGPPPRGEAMRSDHGVSAHLSSPQPGVAPVAQGQLVSGEAAADLAPIHAPSDMCVDMSGAPDPSELSGAYSPVIFAPAAKGACGNGVVQTPDMAHFKSRNSGEVPHVSGVPKDQQPAEPAGEGAASPEGAPAGQAQERASSALRARTTAEEAGRMVKAGAGSAEGDREPGEVCEETAAPAPLEGAHEVMPPKESAPAGSTPPTVPSAAPSGDPLAQKEMVSCGMDPMDKDPTVAEPVLAPSATRGGAAGPKPTSKPAAKLPSGDKQRAGVTKRVSRSRGRESSRSRSSASDWSSSRPSSSSPSSRGISGSRGDRWGDRREDRRKSYRSYSRSRSPVFDGGEVGEIRRSKYYGRGTMSGSGYGRGRSPLPGHRDRYQEYSHMDRNGHRSRHSYGRQSQAYDSEWGYRRGHHEDRYYKGDYERDSQHRSADYRSERYDRYNAVFSAGLPLPWFTPERESGQLSKP